MLAAPEEEPPSGCIRIERWRVDAKTVKPLQQFARHVDRLSTSVAEPAGTARAMVVNSVGDGTGDTLPGPKVPPGVEDGVQILAAMPKQVLVERHQGGIGLTQAALHPHGNIIAFSLTRRW